MEPILEKIPESVKRRFADDYLVIFYQDLKHNTLLDMYSRKKCWQKKEKFKRLRTRQQKI